MKKQKAKFTPEVISIIDGYAAELKPLAQYNSNGQALYKPTQVDGIVLLRSGVLDSQGRPGVPGITYKINQLVYANHRVEMENAFKNQGIEGIHDYAKYVKLKRAQNEAEVEANLPLRIKFQRWFKKLFSRG